MASMRCSCTEGPVRGAFEDLRRGPSGRGFPQSGEQLREEPGFEVYVNSPDTTQAGGAAHGNLAPTSMRKSLFDQAATLLA